MVHVIVHRGTAREQMCFARPIVGPTFFLARQAYAQEIGVDPTDIVLASKA